VPVARLRSTAARYEGRRIDHAAIEAGKAAEECYPVASCEVNLSDGIDRYGEVVRAIKAGDLVAVDKTTADYCGVKLAASPRT
jgi:hypothetical protein